MCDCCKRRALTSAFTSTLPSLSAAEHDDDDDDIMRHINDEN